MCVRVSLCAPVCVDSEAELRGGGDHVVAIATCASVTRGLRPSVSVFVPVGAGVEISIYEKGRSPLKETHS